MGATFFLSISQCNFIPKQLNFQSFFLKAIFDFIFFCISSYFNPFNTQGLEPHLTCGLNLHSLNLHIAMMIHEND
jgi:hypothetical protein